METMSSFQTDNRLMGRKTQTQCDTHEKDIGWLLTDTFEVMVPSEPSELRLGRLEKIHEKYTGKLMLCKEMGLKRNNCFIH